MIRRKRYRWALSLLLLIWLRHTGAIRTAYVAGGPLGAHGPCLCIGPLGLQALRVKTGDIDSISFVALWRFQPQFEISIGRGLVPFYRYR